MGTGKQTLIGPVFTSHLAPTTMTRARERETHRERERARGVGRKEEYHARATIDRSTAVVAHTPGFSPVSYKSLNCLVWGNF